MKRSSSEPPKIAGSIRLARLVTERATCIRNLPLSTEIRREASFLAVKDCAPRCSEKGACAAATAQPVPEVEMAAVAILIRYDLSRGTLRSAVDVAEGVKVLGRGARRQDNQQDRTGNFQRVRVKSKRLDHGYHDKDKMIPSA